MWLIDRALQDIVENGPPKGSRFETNKEFFEKTVKEFSTVCLSFFLPLSWNAKLTRIIKQPEGKAKLDKVAKLQKLAESKLDCTVGQLALAWAAKNSNVYVHAVFVLPAASDG